MASGFLDRLSVIKRTAACNNAVDLGAGLVREPT